MTRRLLSAAIVLAVASCAFAQQWEAKEFTGTSGQVLKYRQLAPEKIDKSVPLPLVLYLHGAGERGSDNELQLKNGASEFFMDAIKRHPCIVLAPQCPSNGRWSGGRSASRPASTSAPAASGPSSRPAASGEMLPTVMELLEKTRKDYDIDPDRIYVMGLSMGGYATWELMARYPKVFAAAIPVCGGGDPSKAPLMRYKGIWVWHGEDDGAVPVNASRTMVKALRDQGDKTRYTELPYVGHDVWVRAFREPTLADWLFKQAMPDKTDAPAPDKATSKPTE